MSPPPELRERLLDIVRADAELSGSRPRRSAARRPWLGRLSPAPALVIAVLLIGFAAVAGYALNNGGAAAGGTRTLPVAAEAPGSSATLVINDSSATLQAKHVPQLPPGSVYQVWVRSNGGATKPSSVFRPSNDGTAAAAVPEVLHGADEVMVTAEPGKGSLSPSSAPIYSARIRS
jgi:hypothetical protein